MNFYHDGSLGDIIYSLPTVKAMGGGNYFIMKKRHYGPMKRLLDLQPYIEMVGYGGWPTNGGVDLRKYRQVANRAITGGERKHLADCHAETCNITIDRESAWIEDLEPLDFADITINRSLRYHDKMGIDYCMLDNRGRQIIFLGRIEEYREFTQMYPIKCWHYECEDALEMARIIIGSKLFVGNQSLGFALAEAMKVPRILEVCIAKDNCRPAGKDGHVELTYDLIERYL